MSDSWRSPSSISWSNLKIKNLRTLTSNINNFKPFWWFLSTSCVVYFGCDARGGKEKECDGQSSHTSKLFWLENFLRFDFWLIRFYRVLAPYNCFILYSMINFGLCSFLLFFFTQFKAMYNFRPVQPNYSAYITALWLLLYRKKRSLFLLIFFLQNKCLFKL